MNEPDISHRTRRQLIDFEFALVLMAERDMTLRRDPLIIGWRRTGRAASRAYHDLEDERYRHTVWRTDEVWEVAIARWIDALPVPRAPPELRRSAPSDSE